MEIRTWEDLEKLIAQLTPEQKKQKVQIAASHPVDDYVIPLAQGIAFATVDEFEFKYVRSIVDNRFHPEEFVILTDGNPHGEDGAIAYELGDDMKKNSIYPKG